MTQFAPIRVVASRLCLTAALAVLGSVAAVAQPLYPQFRLLPNPGSPAHALMGDFTGDGIEDLVVASPGDGRIRVHAITPEGTFAGGANILVGGNPSAVFAADFDRDGDQDIAWSDELTGTVGILLFAPGNPPPYVGLTQPGPDEPTGVVLVDIDDDGWKDLLAAHGGADEVVTYSNLLGDLGPGASNPAGDRPDRLVLLDHAGGPTLALRQSGRLSRDVRLNNLTDGASLTIELPGGGEIFDADLDGDGEDELLVVDELTRELVVRRHAGGAWSETFRFEIDADVSGVAVAESSPGQYQLVVASRDRHRVAVYLLGTNSATRISNWYAGDDCGDLLYQDVDGDAAPDIVVAQTPLHRMQILPPLGSGFYGKPASTAPRGATQIVSAIAGDGSLQLAVPGSLDSQVGVYAVDGITIGEPMLLDAAPGVRAARFGDLDGVAGLDLASVSRTGGMRAHLSDGFGGYVALPGFVPSGEVADLALVDVIGGPALDLVLARLDPPALVVHEGFGDGTFNPVAAAEIATTEPLVVVRARDLDLDGREDLVALGFDSLLTVFMNRAGQPLAGSDLLVQNAPRDVGFGSFNSDPYPDMATINEGNSDYSVVTSVLSGVYTVAARGVPSLPGASRVEVADFNSDGADDLCVIASGTRSVGIHLNTGTAEEPLFRFTPPIQYELVDAAADLAIPDLDQDGTPDLVGLDGEADVLVVRESDPYGEVAQPTAAIRVDDGVSPRRIEVFSDAVYAHDLRLVRQPGGAVIPLTREGPGVFVGFDGDALGLDVTYVVADRTGRELDRLGVAARVPTAAPDPGGPVLLPVRYEPGRAVLRMRAASGILPEIRIYDLRGRRVAELEAVRQEGSWFEASWSGTDLRGRPVSRGRYLVRASLGPVTGTRSIHLR